MKWILFSSVFLICNCIILCQDIIFPDNHTYKNKPAVIGRLPASTPDHCPDKMDLYPVEGTNVSVCDCVPRFLYLPSVDSCYEAYSQGPCPLEHYVAIPEGESTAQCVKNPCLENGLVKYNNTCYPLKTRGAPCAPDVLDFNEITFQLECTKLDITPLIIIGAPKIIKNSTGICPKGSRRTVFGQCKKTIFSIN